MIVLVFAGTKVSEMYISANSDGNYYTNFVICDLSITCVFLDIIVLENELPK